MEKRYRLLIVEDDPDVAEMLASYFSGQGYEIQTAHWGEDGVRASQVAPPDLVLLDIRLPDISGYQVAERLRANLRTAQVPIIFLTEKRDRDDRLRGLQLGAADYVTKPFDIQELRLRVRNALRRAGERPVLNAVTGLPEGPLVEERLGEILTEQRPWVAVRVALRHLGAFRDHYGFVTADDVLRAVGQMLQNALSSQQIEDAFLGHLAPHCFVLFLPAETVPALKARIQDRIARTMDYFYPLKDRLAGNLGADKLSLELRTLPIAPDVFADVQEALAALR